MHIENCKYKNIHVYPFNEHLYLLPDAQLALTSVPNNNNRTTGVMDYADGSVYDIKALQ